MLCFFFFFKQKTAYEMRISDWSSDVCSSDLVTLPSGENWRESATYVGGDAVVVVETPLGRMGLSICYDLRFPELYRALADRGAAVLRSEEHTSELQSLMRISYAVFCLKKKKYHTLQTHDHHSHKVQPETYTQQ